MDDKNSILEVYLDFLQKEVPNGIKYEIIGFVPLDDRFKIYMMSNNKLKFCVCGTDSKKLRDKRFKDKYKLLKRSTFFIYPKEKELQNLNPQNYKFLVSEITKEFLDISLFTKTNDVSDILEYLSKP